MAETIKQRIEREVREKLESYPRQETKHEIKQCHFCSGAVQIIGCVAICNACGATTRRA